MKKSEDKKILVIFGGISCEHDISIITGVMTLNCLKGTRYSPVPVYLRDDGAYTGNALFDLSFYKNFDEKKLRRVFFGLGGNGVFIAKKGTYKPMGEVYCAVNCCHGLNGEDGGAAGVMRLAGVPFASPDMLASSVYIDKAATKIFLKGLGVKTVEYAVLEKRDYYADADGALSKLTEKIGLPAVVKPARLGSSIGIKRAKDRNELRIAVEYAFRFDGKIIVEKALDDFTEINCAAYKRRGQTVVSECERPISRGDVLTFADKYGSGVKHALSRVFPADIPAELSQRIREITKLVYEKSYAVGVIRIDYLIAGGEIYLNEVNTVPGSLALYLFGSGTRDFVDVLSDVIEEGVKEWKEFKSRTFVFRTDVLSSGGGKNNGSKRSTNGDRSGIIKRI